MSMIRVLLLIVSVLGCSFGWHFSSSPATDLQKFFGEQSQGWLGADVATSLQLSGKKYLWLFGDTLVGYMQDQKRVIKRMPRNSIGIMNDPPGDLQYFWKYDEAHPIHGGFFSPPNVTHFLWPIAGITAQNQLFVFAFNVYNTGTDFAFNGTTLVHVPDPQQQPQQWTYTTHYMPHTNNDLTWIAVTQPVDGYLYLLGSASNHGAVLSRISETALSSLQFDRMEYLTVEHTWTQWKEGFQLATLFANVPPETTLQFHPFMKQWFIINVNSFVSNNKITIRTADKLEGPWSEEQELYTIPPPWGKPPVFCYAGKSHPELTTQPDEIIFTFMSNTPDIHSLENDTEVYIPQVIRTIISP